MNACPLSRAALERIERAQAQINGIISLSELAAMLDPGMQNPWRVAGEIAARLKKFKTAFQRIQAGARAPRDDAEVHQVAILAAGICCSRERIFKMLSD